MDAGVAAILGAAVGACGTAIAAGVTGFFGRSHAKLQLAAQREQLERQIRADMATQLREPRRQAYASFDAELQSRLDQLAAASATLDSDPLRLDVAAQQLGDHEPTVSESYRHVAMQGPEDIAYVAARAEAALHGAFASGYAIVADNGENLSGHRTEMDASIATARQALRDFRMLAMKVLRADGGEPELDQARARVASILNRPHRE
ncbi:hypothetical protein ACWD7B_26415 [Streptomyces rubiginosohelvolus]